MDGVLPWGLQDIRRIRVGLYTTSPRVVLMLGHYHLVNRLNSGFTVNGLRADSALTRMQQHSPVF